MELSGFQTSDRFPEKAPADDFVSPSANSAHISPDRFSSLPTPAEHLSRRDATVNAVPRSSGTLASFGQTVEQALTVRDHSDGQVLLSPFVRQNSSPNHYLTQHCSRAFCQVQSISTCTGFRPQKKKGWLVSKLCSSKSRKIFEWLQFSPDRPEPPHRATHPAGNGHGYNFVLPSPTIHRLILLLSGVGIGIVKG